MITILIISVITIIAILIVTYRSNYKINDSRISPKNKQIKNPENPYFELRSMALNMKAEQFKEHTSNEDGRLYALISDLDMGGATVTIVSYISGEASIYLSTGGGFIGAGGHESVRNAAKEFIAFGQKLADKGERYNFHDVPTAGNAHFYFLTTTSKTRIIEPITKLESGESECSNLFIELNKVMSEIRIKSES